MLRKIILSLLLFNGVSACFGGGALLLDPTGKLLQMPLEWLHNGPFQDFWIPGLALFGILGLGSLAVSLLAIRQAPIYPHTLFLLGIAQLIWFGVQLAVVQRMHPLQLIYGSIGIFFVVARRIRVARTKAQPPRVPE